MIDFFEFSNELLCVADRKGFFTRVNSAWTKTLGWSVEELTSRPYMEFVHPADREATLLEAKRLESNTYETIRFENRYRCLNGDFRWLSWQVAPEIDTGLLACAAHDITDQKRQIDTLREVEARFLAFMDNSPAVAWSKDENYRIVFINKTGQDKFDLGPQDWYGKTDFDFWPPDVASRLQDNDRRVFESGLPFRLFEETVANDGKRIFWITILFPYTDRLGQRFVGGMAVDITELKETEYELQRKQELLRNLINVQENEKELLCQEFHDGLIQYAVGSLMSLESCQGDPNSNENVELISNAIRDLRKGVDEGRRVIRGIRPAVLDDSGLEAAIDDLVDQYSAAEIHVKKSCDPEIGRLSDAVQLTVYRVIQESLNNAKKYSGTDVVRINLRKVGEELLIEVRDFGNGFDVNSARQRGFGIRGMTERVRLLGGDFFIESEADNGTTIRVRIPLTGAAQFVET